MALRRCYASYASSIKKQKPKAKIPGGGDGERSKARTQDDNLRGFPAGVFFMDSVSYYVGLHGAASQDCTTPNLPRYLR